MFSILSILGKHVQSILQQQFFCRTNRPHGELDRDESSRTDLIADVIDKNSHRNAKERCKYSPPTFVACHYDFPPFLSGRDHFLI